MEEPSRVSFRNGRLASRKAEEAACRRSQAAMWLEKMAGPLGLPSQPTEQEFVSCLKNGLVLCNTINKIQPGAVSKVVTNQSLGHTWENQTLPAYQYFENIRNFLVAVEELKVPSFEASDLERDILEVASVGKIVDCILGLKAYHEWKQFSGGNGSWKYVKSPMVSHSTGRTQSNTSALGSSVRRLELSATSEKRLSMKNDDKKGKLDCLVQAIVDCLFNAKENIDQVIFDSWRQGKLDSLTVLNKIISSSQQELQLKLILEDLLTQGSTISEYDDATKGPRSCGFCLGKASCNHWQLVESQETELEEIKALLTKTKLEFAALQSQLQNDLIQLGTQFQGLSAAVVGYHRAVKENRNLYNMLQELRGNIRVFCRVRPTFIAETKSSIDYIGNDGTLIIVDPLKTQNTRRIFQFNKVLGPNSTQEEVYKEAESLIRSVMDGYNVCIFAYGQTGSGKTYTMCGPENGSTMNTGINYKALNDLFHISCSREDLKYEMHVQMVEIYNEQVRDLLSDEATTTKLEIRNCSSNGGLTLPDATVLSVQSTGDVMNLMKLGEKNRAFSCTAMNNRSSRSHSVLTIHVCGRDFAGNTIRSCLHLVDLAGSERVDKSEVTGDRLKEAQHINKSLSCLGDVIAALAQKSPFIPYRNSKLTLLLQNSLGGHAKMLMLAHISPESESFGETISTLKFAQRVSTVELGAAHVNKESSEIRELKDEIDNLKKELVRKEGEKASCLHKMKENTPIVERLKQNEPTPPRPKPSLEKATVIYLDERKVFIKSPLPRPKFSSEHSFVRLRRSSQEGSRHVKNAQQATEMLENENAQTKAEDLKEVVQQGTEADDCSPCSPDIISCSPIKTGSRYGQSDEAKTPDILSQKMSSTKRSHLRKSLLTIGKLINGSDNRNNQGSSVISTTKLDREKESDRKSPLRSKLRYRRRQSLTTVQALEMKTSRRSSLGGNSVDSCTTANNVHGERTPPAFPSSTKTARPWL